MLFPHHRSSGIGSVCVNLVSQTLPMHHFGPYQYCMVGDIFHSFPIPSPCVSVSSPLPCSSLYPAFPFSVPNTQICHSRSGSGSQSHCFRQHVAEYCCWKSCEPVTFLCLGDISHPLFQLPLLNNPSLTQPGPQSQTGIFLPLLKTFSSAHLASVSCDFFQRRLSK